MRLVLVTGAPRSGTTPVGAALALAPGARMIYEPMGPTGDSRIPVRFAIPGQEGLTHEAFHSFIDDLNVLKLQLGRQKRKSYTNMTTVQRLVRGVIGSRTRISYLTAKYSPGPKTIVWKDPMASFSLPSVLGHGVPSVVCVRNPLAHAASFKRKGWTVDVGSIYPSFRNGYGAIPKIERLVSSGLHISSVASASILWHMVYVLTLRTLHDEFGKFSVPLLIVSGTELEADEMGVYSRVFRSLGLKFEGRPQRSLEKRVSTAVKDPGPQSKTHHWTRSVSTTNSYWRDILSAQEIALVDDLNASVFVELEQLRDKLHEP